MTSKRKTQSASAASSSAMVRLRPCDCECLTDLMSLDSTHKSVGRFDMLLQHDQAVILTEHPIGEKCRAQIVIPKHVFRQMLDWYATEQPNDKLSHGDVDAEFIGGVWTGKTKLWRV